MSIGSTLLDPPRSAAADEIIEAVLQNRGETALVGSSTLADTGRIAAVLRY